jgi:hypothetical protein
MTEEELEIEKKKLIEHINQNYQKFLEYLEKHIRHTMSITKIPINSYEWEEILSNTYEDLGYTTVHNIGSHKPGKDIDILSKFIKDVFFGISAKSATESGKKDSHTLKISSYRLTRFKNEDVNKKLDDILKFINENSNNFDNYHILLRTQDKKEKNIKYTFYDIPSNVFNVYNMVWESTNTGYKTTEKSHISAKIVTSMSSQLWIEVKLDKIDQYRKFTIEEKIETLAQNRYRANS